MEISLGLDIIGYIIGVIIAYGLISIKDAIGDISTYLMKIDKEIKEAGVVDARVTRRDINDDYGFRNPLLRSETGYRVNRRGQYVPNKPNVEEDEDV